MNKIFAIVCAVCLVVPFILSFKARNPRKFRRYAIALSFCILLTAVFYIPKDPNYVVIDRTGMVVEENKEAEQDSMTGQKGSSWCYASDLDLSMYSVAAVAESSATNYKETASHAYPTSNLFDGEIETCWQDGVEGYGEGTEFYITLQESSNVQCIVIQNGRSRSDEKYFQNGRVCQLEINNGIFVETIELPDENTPIAIMVNGWENVCFVSFKIQSVYPGSEYEDTCITEITFYR